MISTLAPRKARVVKKYVNVSLCARILASRVCGAWGVRGVSKLIAGLGSVFFMRLALRHIATYKLMGKIVPTMWLIHKKILATIIWILFIWKVLTTKKHEGMDTTNVYALVKVRTTAAKSAMAQDEAKKMIITFFSCRGYMKGRKIRQNLSHESSPTVNKRAKTPKVLMKADIGIPRNQTASLVHFQSWLLYLQDTEIHEWLCWLLGRKWQEIPSCRACSVISRVLHVASTEKRMMSRNNTVLIVVTNTWASSKNLSSSCRC